MKRFGITSIGVLALGIFATPALAIPISGGISIASVPASMPGLSPLIPVNGATGVATTLGAATGFDFTTSGLATPGVPGGFSVSGDNGSFLAAGIFGGALGTIADFSFAGAGSASFPLPPVTPLELISGPGFAFDLLSVHVDSQTNTELDLSGTGLFHLGGFTNTPGTFTFTGNQGGGTFSFSASDAVAAPEPGTMMLLGTGLFGLGASLRRRFKI